ncbi:MAG TPA: hypothetical protein VJ598_12170, partial [Albitalea sp.]|nr:hypothetical protein [Albitalea sp.]
MEPFPSQHKGTNRRSSMLAWPVFTARLSSVRRTAGNRVDRWVASVALSAACATPVLAQPASPSGEATGVQAPAGWFSVELPGTSEGLSRVVGHETTVEPARLMLEMVRLTESAQMTLDHSIDLARRQLTAYLDAVEQLQDILAK